MLKRIGKSYVIVDLSKSGSGSLTMLNCMIYNELSFIRDIISNRVTSSNQTFSNSQQSSSQSQSPIFSAPVSISLAPPPMNTTIHSNNDSKNLYKPLEQQKNYDTLKPIMKKGKKGKLSE